MLYLIFVLLMAHLAAIGQMGKRLIILRAVGKLLWYALSVVVESAMVIMMHACKILHTGAQNIHAKNQKCIVNHGAKI
jgi:hypothetical protein